MKPAASILDLIGSTPLLRLARLVRALLVVVLVGVPFFWPIGIYLGWRWYRRGQKAKKAQRLGEHSRTLTDRSVLDCR